MEKKHPLPQKYPSILVHNCRLVFIIYSSVIRIMHVAVYERVVVIAAAGNGVSAFEGGCH